MSRRTSQAGGLAQALASLGLGWRRPSGALALAGLRIFGYMQPITKEKIMSLCDPSTPARGAYAGIGSRATPVDVLELMSAAVARLASENWTLRTGGAKGADQAFLEGAISVSGCAELYLPWPGYNEHRASRLARPSSQAFAIAERHHPAWSACGEAARSLHARNCHRVLGQLLDDPAAFVVCYTPDGSLTGATRAAGGTGQALRVAVAASVPVFNLSRREHRERVEDWVTA
jgi:hypothetical protein